MEIEIGHLGLHPEGICYYGKGGLRVVFEYPIQIGLHKLIDFEGKYIRFEIVREGKTMFIIGYDDSRLGMVVKAEIHRVHVMPVILESICRKFKVGSGLYNMKKGVRIWIKSPDTVDEKDLREFLCRKQKRSEIEMFDRFIY